MCMIRFKMFWIAAFGNQWIQWNKSKCIFFISGNSKFSIRGKKSWSAGNGLDLKEKFNKNYPIRRIVQRIRHKKMGVIFSTEDVETENESFFDAKYIYKISITPILPILNFGSHTQKPTVWIIEIYIFLEIFRLRV